MKLHLTLPLIAALVSTSAALADCKAERLQAGLDASTRSLGKLLSQQPSEEKALALNSARKSGDESLNPATIECARKTPALFSKSLEFGGLICVEDAYQEGLDFLFDLEKEPQFESALKALKPELSGCLRKFLKERKREMEEGNG